MVDEYATSPGDDAGDQVPRPYDTVFLRPGNRFNIPHTTPLIIADAAYEVYELNHQEHHPDYWDWAAAAELADLATIVRITPDGATSSWVLAP